MELNIVWFVLLVVLFSGYVILDGFDLGVGMIHFKAKNDTERRTMLNAIGPFWDGNEVWLITAGGALFAAFPNVYATVFSGFYTAFMLFLLVLIGSKEESVRWRSAWDHVFHVSSYLIALLLGVSLGNILSGVPIVIINGSKEFGGNFFTLLNPFSVLVGLVAVLGLRMHGSIYIALKTEGDLRDRVAGSIKRSFAFFLAAYAIAGIWIWIAMPQITSNFINHPIWLVFQLLAATGFVFVWIFSGKKDYMKAFLASALILLSSIAMSGIGIFPNLLIASNNPADSLTIFADSSSQPTLFTMMIIALIFVPIILIYKFIVYRIFKGKVKVESGSY
jgi:cytochrome d ubiquinol oxidase subunit II